MIQVKPKNKKVYMDNLTAAGFKFSTKPNSVMVCVQLETEADLFRVMEISDE